MIQKKVRRRRSRRQVEFHTGDHEIYNGEPLLGGISDENLSCVGSRSIIEARMYCNTFSALKISLHFIGGIHILYRNVLHSGILYFFNPNILSVPLKSTAERGCPQEIFVHKPAAGGTLNYKHYMLLVAVLWAMYCTLTTLLHYLLQCDIAQLLKY